MKKVLVIIVLLILSTSIYAGTITLSSGSFLLYNSTLDKFLDASYKFSTTDCTSFVLTAENDKAIVIYQPKFFRQNITTLKRWSVIAKRHKIKSVSKQLPYTIIVGAFNAFGSVIKSNITTAVMYFIYAWPEGAGLMIKTKPTMQNYTPIEVPSLWFTMDAYEALYK